METDEFDWFTGPFNRDQYHKPQFLSFMQIKSETPYDRKKRMIDQLSTTCLTCSMCELGLTEAEKIEKEGSTVRDPHVLSNLNPKRFIIIGQNPGWDELKKRQPFIGQSGKNFDHEIAKHGYNRSEFYITNIVKCYTKDNAKPSSTHITKCSPFLQMEINIIRPLLVITLGSVAFSGLCPNFKYSDRLGQITKSEPYGVKVFAVLHPSPLNLSDKARKEEFSRQISTMCRLIDALKSQQDTPDSG